MAATLTTMEAAIVTALAALNNSGAPTAAKPFRHVSRWAGDLDAIEGVARAVLTQSPALIVGLDNLRGGVAEDSAEDTNARIENIITATFALFIVVADTRPPPTTLTSTVAASFGVYGLVDLVVSAVNNLFVSGSWNENPLRVTRVLPYFVQPGVCYVMRVDVVGRYVMTDAAVPTALAGEETVLNTIDVDVNRDGTLDDGTAPLATENPRNEVRETDLDS